MPERDYMAERIRILKDMLAAIELCDDDMYADRYDELIALEKEAGEFDGEDCECELEICPACGGVEGAPCTVCLGDQVIDKSIATAKACWACGTPYHELGGCEFCPAKPEPPGQARQTVTLLLQPGEKIIAYHSEHGCGGPIADLVTCEHCRAGITRCLKCGTVWSTHRPAVSTEEVPS